jgi:hypothetical protein
MIRYLTLAAVLMAATAPACAQTAADPTNVKAIDVVTTPLAELNLRKGEIPPVLLAARERPYTLAAMRSCPAIQREVLKLDAALGDDIDVVVEKTREEKRGNTVGSIARSLIGSLMPMGGVIREISGANANDRQVQLAIYAGASRRAFLKGYGLQKGCRYPARPASVADIVALAKARQSASTVAAKAKR